jgi:hypothetical protein
MGGSDTTPEPDRQETPENPEAVERRSLGVAALFEGVRPSAEHAVLDMGRAAEASLEVYGRYARNVRFADLLRDERRRIWSSALEASVPVQPQRPYDIILGWNVLDRLGPEARAPLVERLAERSAPGARIHVLVDATEDRTVRPLRFTVLDVDRVRYEPDGPEEMARPRLLPAQVERLLDPFEVVRAFTSRSGMREYVGVRR